MNVWRTNWNREGSMVGCRFAWHDKAALRKQDGNQPGPTSSKKDKTE
jgi:hypothetical protein